MVNVADLTITSLETILALDYATDAFKFLLDELQSATIAQAEDSTEITGKQGRRLATLKRNKSITISGTNGLVSAGLLEVQTGSDFENKATEVSYIDYLTVTSNEATTSWKAIGTAGAEIKELYLVEKSGVARTELTQDSAAAEGKFAYAPATKKLTFSGIADGTEIVVIYNRKITTDVLENLSDNYSAKCKLFIDCLAEDKCANVYRVQIFVPKADFSGEFSLEFGDNQTVHEFSAESLAGACGGKSTLFKIVVFDEDTEDDA